MRQHKYRIFMAGEMLYPPFEFWIHDGEFFNTLEGVVVDKKTGELNGHY